MDSGKLFLAIFSWQGKTNIYVYLYIHPEGSDQSLNWPLFFIHWQQEASLQPSSKVHNSSPNQPNPSPLHHSSTTLWIT